MIGNESLLLIIVVVIVIILRYELTSQVPLINPIYHVVI